MIYLPIDIAILSNEKQTLTKTITILFVKHYHLKLFSANPTPWTRRGWQTINKLVPSQF